MKNQRHCICLVAFLLTSVTVVNAGQKKYISFGWEYKRLTPSMILANAEKFKDTAIDGM